MKRIRKYLLAGCLAIGLLVTISIALILGSRWLTNSETVRQKITTETQRLTGGQLRYDRLALHLLPLPHLTALQVDFKVPGKMSLRTASLAIYPDLLSLVSGSFQLEKLRSVRPVARIEMPEQAETSREPGKSWTSQEYSEAPKVIFGALAKLGPDLDIIVQAGTFNLHRPGRSELVVEKIDLRVKSRRQQVTLALQGQSEISGKVDLKAAVNLDTRDSDGRLKLEGLNARALLVELPPLPGGIALSDTRLDLEMTFRAPAAEQVKATLAFQVPVISLQRKNQRITLQDIAFKGTLGADNAALDWNLQSLRVGSHGLDLGAIGQYTYGDPKTPPTLELDAIAKRIDVASVAHSFTAFAGDQGWVQSAFGIARAGILEKTTCRLVVRKAGGKWTVTEIKAAGRLGAGLIRIPGADLDLTEVNGQVVLDNQRVDFKQMQGRLPFGTFDRLDAHIDWRQTARLGVSTPKAALAMERFYTWLSAFEGLQDLQAFITAADGGLSLTKLELHGPLTAPADWLIEVAAGLENVSITSPKMTGPLRLLQGHASFKPEFFTLEKTQFKYLDADAVTSCKILGKPGRPEVFNLFLDGTIGEQALAWIRRFLTPPEHLRIHAPLKISGMNLQWDNRANVTVAGEIIVAGGTRVIADAVFAPEQWQVKRFEIKDEFSDVSIKLTRADRHFDLAYAGKLQKATLDRLLRDNQSLKGWVDGALRATFDIKRLETSTIRGDLRGEGLVVRRLPVSPVEFERFSLIGAGDHVRLESTDLIFAGESMHLKGTASITAQAYTFDLDLETGHLDAAVFDKIAKESTAETADSQADKQGDAKTTDDGPPAEAQAEIPIDGVIHLKTPKFVIGDYAWSPLHAEIVIKPNNVTVTTTQAELCGIPTPGTITITEQGLDLVFKPAVANQNFQQTWECLQDKPLQAESLFSLIATLEASGPAADLVQNLSGDIAFSSDDGLIYKANMLTKVLAFLNITEVIIGESSGLRDKGFGYDAVRVHASVAGGKLIFDEILIDAHTMKVSGVGVVDLAAKTVDITLLVAPLKTLDRLVRNLPVIGYITGGSILSVPVKITGSMSNPEVKAMAPGAVGRNLVGILERTLKAPLKVVDSLPGTGGEPAAADVDKSGSQTE